MLNYVFFVMLLLAGLNSLTPPAEGGEAAPIKPKVLLFSGRSCGSCKSIEQALKAFGVGVHLYNIDHSESYQRLIEIEESLQQEATALPVMVYGSTLVSSKQEIMKKIGAASTWYHTLKHGPIALGGPADIPVSFLVEHRFAGLSLAVIGLAGLADGVNPCAFATMVFLVGALSLSGRNRNAVLLTGLSFTLGVFTAYLGIGLGLFHALTAMTQFNLIRAWFHLAVLTTLLVAATCLLGDAFYVWSHEGMPFFKLPGSLRRKINALIARSLHRKGVFISAFCLGAMISVLELACTGQVYLPTIVYIMDHPRLGSLATGYFLIYNLAFILPLLGILGLSLQGLRVDRLHHFITQHAALSKAFMGAMLLLMFSLLAIR